MAIGQQWTNIQNWVKKQTSGNMLFSEFVEWYFDNYAKNQLKAITQLNYRQMLNHRVLPVLGNKRLKEFNNIMLTEYFQGMDASPTTCRTIYVILRSVFSCALRMGFVDKHPCDNVILPKPQYRPEQEKPLLNREQAATLMAMTEEYSDIHCIVRFLLLTGMRSGEAFGLRWADLDFDHMVIHIQYNLANVGGKHWLDSPKTKNSIRQIPMSQQVKDLLLERKEHQLLEIQKRKKDGYSYEHPEMVFASTRGNYASHNYMETKYKLLVKDTDFSHTTLHSLRHANATLMLANGVDLKVVSSLLGHSNISTTADIYAAVLDECKAQAAQTVVLQLFA